MTTVVGLDSSLTAFGMARITWGSDAPAVAEAWHRGEDGITTMSLADKHRAIVRITSDVLAFTQPADLVVIEGASHASKSVSANERAYLWWRVVGKLIEHTPVVVVQPKTRAKWVTGDGNAGKTAVAIAVGRAWPDVTIRDDNEADALGLASIGVQMLGGPCPFPPTKYRDEVCARLRLPEEEAA